MVEKVTKLAQAWHDEGCDDKHTIDNVVDEIVYDIIEDYGLDLTDAQDAKLESLLKDIVTDNIDWEEIRRADADAKDYKDAKRGAIYGY